MLLHNNYIILDLCFPGNFSVGDCEEFHNLSSNLTEVGTTGTVCFQCLGTDPVETWTINGQPVSSSVGASSADGILAVFIASQVFSVESPSVVRCLTLFADAEYFVILQGELHGISHGVCFLYQNSGLYTKVIVLVLCRAPTTISGDNSKFQ